MGTFDKGGDIIFYYEAILQEIDRLTGLVEKVQSKLDQAVTGAIICETRGQGFRYIHSYSRAGKRKRKILKDSDKKLMKELVEKYQNQQILRKLKRELDAAQAYKEKYESSSGRARQNPAGFSALLNEFFPTSDLEEWGSAPYRDSRDFYPEQLKYKTGKGDERVRSKSELLIAQALQAHGIQYHYEEMTEVGYHTYRIDFTIRHPVTGEYIIWEHFGMMDNPKYARDTADKIRTYMINGYSPTTNLIMTFEDKDHPLQISVIEEIINRMLLNDPVLVE